MLFNKKSSSKPISKEEIGKVVKELFPTQPPGPNCFKVTFPKMVMEQVIPTSCKLS